MPIREIEITELEVDYPRFGKLIGKSPDRIHCSEGVKVMAWGKNGK